jgi:hypothetical protein
MRSRIFTAFITVYCWTISETVSSIPKFHDYFFFILHSFRTFNCISFSHTVSSFYNLWHSFLRDLIRSELRLSSPVRLVLCNLFTSYFRHVILLIFANHFIYFLRPEVKYSFNKSQQDVLFLKFILIKDSTCFGKTYCPSSGVPTLYLQQ